MKGRLREAWRTLAGLPQRRDLARAALAGWMGPLAPRREVRRLLRRCLLAQAGIRLEHAGLRLASRRRRRLHPERLTDLAASGRGALVCSAHLGPIFYLPVELGRMRYSVSVLMAPSVEARFGALFHRLGRRHQTRLVTLDASRPRSLLEGMRVLGAGSLLVAFVDAHVAVGRPMAAEEHLARFEFLGMPVARRTSLAHLARRAAVPLVPAAVFRSSGGRMVEFGEPIETVDRDPAEVTRELYACLEGWIRDHPEQWEGWFYPHAFWGRSGTPRLATPAELLRTEERLRALLDTGSTRVRCASDPFAVAVMRHGSQHYLLEVRARRLMPVSAAVARMVRRARARCRLARLVSRHPEGREGMLRDLSRLMLAGLVRLEGAPAPGVDRAAGRADDAGS